MKSKSKGTILHQDRNLGKLVIDLDQVLGRGADCFEYGVVRILDDRNLCMKIYDTGGGRYKHFPLKIIKSLIDNPLPGVCRVFSVGTLEFNGRGKNHYIIMKTYEQVDGEKIKSFDEIKKFIDVFLEVKKLGYFHGDSKFNNFCIDPETNLPVLVDLQALQVYNVHGFVAQVHMLLVSLSRFLPRETSKTLKSRFLLYHPDLIDRLFQDNPPKLTAEEYSRLPLPMKDRHERLFFQRLLNNPNHRDDLPGVVDYKLRILRTKGVFANLEEYLLSNPPPEGFYLERGVFDRFGSF